LRKKGSEEAKTSSVKNAFPRLLAPRGKLKYGISSEYRDARVTFDYRHVPADQLSVNYHINGACDHREYIRQLLITETLIAPGT